MRALPLDVLRFTLELTVVGERGQQPRVALFLLSRQCYTWLRPAAYRVVRIASATALDALCVSIAARAPRDTIFADAVRHLGVHFSLDDARSQQAVPPHTLLSAHARKLAAVARACTGLVSFASNIFTTSVPLRFARLFGAGAPRVPVSHTHRLTHLDIGPMPVHSSHFYHGTADPEDMASEQDIVLSSDIIAVLPALTHLAVACAAPGYFTAYLPAVLRNRRLRAVLLYGLPLTGDPGLRALVVSARGDKRVRFLFAEETCALFGRFGSMWEAHLACGDAAFTVGIPVADVPQL